MNDRLPSDLEAHVARLSEETGIRLWRSLEELADAPEMQRFLEAEFPDAMQTAAVDRRTLLRLMSASFALGGLAACNGNQPGFGAPLLSQSRNAPGYTPGTALAVASSIELNGYGRGVLIKTQEGRPFKVEGNALHPASLGATDVFAQAEILNLYDPDRSDAPLEDGVRRTWNEFGALARSMRDELAAGQGRGLHVLLPPIASPTQDRLVAQVQRLFPQARWHRFSPIDEDNRRAGARAVYGREIDVIYDLTRTDVVVTLGGDLFADEPGHLRYAADYQARRRASDRPLPRLVAIESCPSLAGARADERLVLRPRDIEPFAQGLAAALQAGASPPEIVHEAVNRLATDLGRAGTGGLVVAGREQPPRVHALALAINARLGAFGTALRAIEPVSSSTGGPGAVQDLARAIRDGDVSTLLVLGGNPAYTAPADTDLAALIRRVPRTLHLGSHRDETAAACHWHVPQSHGFESWGDLRAFDGTAGIRQPAVLPLRPGLSVEEVLGLLTGQDQDGRALVQATWRGVWGDDFDKRWSRALEDGIVENSAAPSLELAVKAGWDAGFEARSPSRDLDVVFSSDASVWDGRYANNGWLHELPKPLTKQVWGNAALIGPDTATSLGLSTGDVVELTVEERTLRAPVWVLPGHAPGAVTLPLGYGRSQAGRVGDGIGFNAYAVRPSARSWMASGEIRPVGERTALVTTQHHHALQSRDIVRVMQPNQGGVAPAAVQPSFYPEWTSDGHAWGMAIDLDACIGCNACVIACQAENNIAVVGPEEAARGREMHWLRVDRYYAGDPIEPRTYFQPVPCMHCEKAPCEVVCPVNATVHSSEGLNDMVYNRCIGTRTCSNNCPYKVRRFNFFDYQDTAYAAADGAANPHVTVRERGVMEKCTYCVHRIGAARADARVQNRRLRDGDVTTACQQACPTQAIVFGDINDPGSAVSRLKADPRNYTLLGHLNTQPRTSYLARIEPAPATEPNDPSRQE